MSQPTPSLTELEQHLVSFVHQTFALTGEILSAESASNTYGVPIDKYTAALNKQAFRDALSERGIILARSDLAGPETNDDAFLKHALEPLQLLAANSILDLTDTRTIKKKLQDLGVSTAKYQTWLKDPVFQNYLQKRAEQNLDESRHEADNALMDKIRMGDIKAIEYYNEMMGRFTRQRSNSSSVDVQNILVKIVEIINDEVQDYDTALRISSRLRSLAAARNTAIALTTQDDPIVMPDVAPTRKELES